MTIYLDLFRGVGKSIGGFLLLAILDYKKVTVATLKIINHQMKNFSWCCYYERNQSKIIFGYYFFVDELGNNSHSDKIYFSGSMSRQSRRYASYGLWN
jgi:hypothetical protein